MVVGDLILDRYIWGEVTRISPEAPVPVVRWQRQTEQLGGAANVAANLKGLGAQVTLAGFAGADAEGDHILQMLTDVAAVATPVVRRPDRPTTTKLRVMGGHQHQQMLRLDREDDRPASADDEARLLEGVTQAIKTKPVEGPDLDPSALRPSIKVMEGSGGGFFSAAEAPPLPTAESSKIAAVILADYAKGVISERVAKSVISEAHSHGLPVFVDPKGRDYSKYRKATALTPNRAELALACGVSQEPLDELLEAGARLRRHLDLDFLAVTRGEEGITLIEPDARLDVPAVAQQVFDVSGAGDTVIATLAAGLAAGLNRLEAIHLANLAAGIVVGKVGTAPVHREELLEALVSEGELGKCGLEEDGRR